MADALTAWAQSLQIVGLAFEAWGAAFLLGEYVGNDFRRVREWGRRRLQDLVMEDTRARERSRFFGLPGVLILVFGFILQMAGLTLQATGSVRLVVVGAGILCLLIGYTVHRLVRSGTDKPYREIVGILAANARGWLTRHSWRLRCAVCHRRLEEKHCRVWWIVNDSGKASYVHAGHEACLGELDGYLQYEAPDYVKRVVKEGVVRRTLEDVRLQGLGVPLEPHDEWSRDALDRLGLPRVP